LEKQQFNQEMYIGCPYLNEYYPIENHFRDDDFYRHHGRYGYRPYGWYNYGSPYWYGHGLGHHGWHGHHGRYRDNEEDERHDYNYIPQPMQTPCPMQMECPVQPVQPVQPIEKNYNEFKSLEKNSNITEINNTIIKIEQKHPYMMKKLLLLGLAEEECKKILYLVLLCCGKFDL
jgi:hypothetical protein